MMDKNKIIENKSNEDIMVKCEFCGFTFKRCDGKSCNGCPINCKIIKCPNCGYEILPESKSYEFIENSYNKLKGLIKANNKK